MLNFDSLEKGRFSCYILLTKQISSSDSLYFLRYWAIFYWVFFIFHHFSSVIWKSQHWHLGISIGIDVGIGIAKNLFCLAKPLFLPFEVLYEEKIYGEVLFKYTC